MNNNQNDKKMEDLMGDKSVLNIEAQKELFDHNLKSATNNALKIFFIIFPIMLIVILGIVFGTIYFARTLH
jgi:hypothetical protein